MSEEEIVKRLFKAYHKARQHKRGTVDQKKFETHLDENIILLKNDIVERKYKPSRSVAFIIQEPKMREIFAAPFRDRVIHHFICDLIVEWWERHLIYASYSCRKDKGTDAGRRDFYAKARRASKNFQEPVYAIKIDLSSYFCSIDRRKLWNRVNWGLKQQFLVEMGGSRGKAIYRMLNLLCSRVIFDNPVNGVRLKCGRKGWNDYPAQKSLFNQPKGKGIVIGNLTSQVFSNIYLDAFDRFCTFELKEKFYGRYVDDAFFIVKEGEKDEFFQVKMPMIRDFLGGMGLRLNEKKTHCQYFSHGVEFLGAHFAPYRVMPGKLIRANFVKTTRLVVAGEKDIDCLVSCLGLLSHFDSQKFIAKTFQRYGQDFVPDKRLFNSLYFTSPKEYERLRAME